MEILTSRLLLREFIENDLDAIFHYESDPNVVKYVCYGSTTRIDCERELQFHIQHQQLQSRIFYHLALELCETKAMIGWCGIKIVNTQHSEGELGYALDQAYWGRGYMFEAAKSMVAFGFQTLRLHRIYGTCHPDNYSSIRVLEKIGMQYEGCFRENRLCKGNWRNTNIYAILEQEWSNLNQTVD